MNEAERELKLTPDRVVVGVDGSDSAQRAVAFAARQAAKERRPLAVLHAIRSREATPSAWLDLYGPVPYRFLGPAEPVGTIVDDAVAVARSAVPGLDVTGSTATGDPRDVLTRASMTAGLLVVGSRGRGPVRSALLGSVGAAVAREAKCPVIVTRPDRPGAVGDGVVVAADLTEESRPVIDFAYRQASLHDLPLTIMHCHWDDAPPTDDSRVSAEAGRRRRLLAESVAGFAELYPDVHVTRMTAHGLVAECLTQGRARSWHLIVVGRHTRHGVARFGSTHATAVLERADCPVAVVPQGGVRTKASDSVTDGQSA